ncbi:hypothetical protein BH10PSE9_BH10PSE9_05730 [soil metagenome]
MPALRTLLAAMLCAAGTANAAEPARHVAIYVQPYYESGRTAEAPPKVNIGATFNPLLASLRKEDILAARDRIAAEPKLVTPMTMMVLAIRLYDIGQRDDAAFWFYAAKDRYITLADVIDIGAAGLGGVEDAVKSFVTLAGPFINGYAFCDIANQQAIRTRELDWVEANPYGAIFLDRVPARPGDRAANLGASIPRSGPVLRKNATTSRTRRTSPTSPHLGRRTRWTRNSAGGDGAL